MLSYSKHFCYCHTCLCSQISISKQMQRWPLTHHPNDQGLNSSSSRASYDLTPNANFYFSWNGFDRAAHHSRLGWTLQHCKSYPKPSNQYTVAHNRFGWNVLYRISCIISSSAIVSDLNKLTVSRSISGWRLNEQNTIGWLENECNCSNMGIVGSARARERSRVWVFVCFYYMV